MKHEDPNTEYKPTSFICSHVADRSLLAQGFTLPGAMLVDVQFRRAAKSFAYPNGLVEPLKMNVHL